MVFENKSISEITDKELINLIGNQEENLWIDFKQRYDGYKTDDTEYKREIRKDVTAMANAEGGYILIGVDESNKIAQGFSAFLMQKNKLKSSTTLVTNI